MPIVKLDFGARAGSSPHIFHTGTPSRLPTMSWSAALTALLAPPTPRSTRVISCSIASSDQPSHRSMMGTISFSAAALMSTLSP